MIPVVLIHGFSSEGNTPKGADYDVAAIRRLYGSLIDDLRALNIGIVEIDVSRFISMDDGVGIDDISLAFERALHATEFKALLDSGFDVIIHSTGALVVRNWIRRYTQPGQCPIRHLIHLAGANLGSGWAHVGSTRLAKFLRYVFVQGEHRGLAVLSALELGSSWTIDLHTHFLSDGHDMLADYKVMEFCLIGSQTPPEYLALPVRYGHEDGSDGVIRVSACNLNFHYLRFEPTPAALALKWDEASGYVPHPDSVQAMQTAAQPNGEPEYYALTFSSAPGTPAETRQGSESTARPVIPFAIPYGTDHSDRSGQNGIVDGTKNRTAVLPLVELALQATSATYAGLVSDFQTATDQTYESVAKPQHAQGVLAFLANAIKSVFDPYSQYDPHAQVVFRLRDQYGAPVNDYSIFFNSFGGDDTPNRLINDLFEDQHQNDHTPNTINFYLRTHRWQANPPGWVSQLDTVNGVQLEIDAVDPLTQRVLFLPLRLQITAEALREWIVPHRTTIVDVTLVRLPHPVTFLLKRT